MILIVASLFGIKRLDVKVLVCYEIKLKENTLKK